MNFSFKAIFFRVMFATYDFCVKLALLAKTQVKVKSGPFKGMKYGLGSVCSTLTPKLLGTYEKELSGIIEQLPVFDLVIDIGAAEGWYAVGLLYRKTAQKVTAFELTENGRESCRANAARNGVSGQLEIRDNCTPEAFLPLIRFSSAKGERILIISDCEGCEDGLFTPDTLPFCKQAYLLIETHEQFVLGINRRLVRDLSTSHIVTSVHPARRSKADMPENSGLFKIPVLNRLLMSERRGQGTGWLYAIPKSEAK